MRYGASGPARAPPSPAQLGLVLRPKQMNASQVSADEDRAAPQQDRYLGPPLYKNALAQARAGRESNLLVLFIMPMVIPPASDSGAESKVHPSMRHACPPRALLSLAPSHPRVITSIITNDRIPVGRTAFQCRARPRRLTGRSDGPAPSRRMITYQSIRG